MFLIALNRAVPCRPVPRFSRFNSLCLVSPYRKTRYNAALAVPFKSAVVLLPARIVTFSAFGLDWTPAGLFTGKRCQELEAELAGILDALRESENEMSLCFTRLHCQIIGPLVGCTG